MFECVLALGSATISDIENRMPDAPSGSALRAMLSRLEEKGFITHKAVAKKNVYSARPVEAAARKSALRQMVSAFFNNSPASAAAALLGLDEQMERKELDALEQLIRKAKEQAK